jgi:hypothetical protein
MSGYEPPKSTMFRVPNPVSMPPIGNHAPRAVHVKATSEPLDFWRAVYMDESQPMWRRMDAAIAALPYRHFNLAAKEFRDLSPEQLKRIRDARVR